MNDSQLILLLLRLLVMGVTTVLTGTTGVPESQENSGDTRSAASPDTAVVAEGAVTVVGGSVRRTEPLTCWTCSSSSHGNDCYDLDYENPTFTTSASSNCSQDEAFCTVNRIWFVAEGGLEEMNFSVNRTCAAVCDPSCMVIGDRTKIHNCISCCSEPLCNTGSSAGATHSNSAPFLKVALMAALTPTMISSALWLH